LVEAGIPHVVAIRSDTPVVDHAAVVFIGQFYRSLFKGDSVQKAFEMAKLLVEGNLELMKIKRHLKFTAYKKREPFVPEEEKFVLLQSTMDTAPFLSHVPQGTITVKEPALSDSNLPIKLQSFTGRSAEMHDIITELLKNRLVTITGVGGVGKTVLAREVARWFCSRGNFDGVYYIDLRQTDTAEGVIALLGAALNEQFSKLEDVITCFQGLRCLLLLDNAEDILWHDEDAFQNLIDTLLQYTPHILLITSQRPIGGNLYESERVYRLSSLRQRYAELLFCATTKRRMVRREQESATFRDLLKHLGGHPLSIVITARQLAPGIFLEDLLTRINTYKAKAISVKGITDKNGSHGESLVASLASAHHVLSDDAQTLFEVLSSLPAGARKDMLTAIAGDTAWEHVQELNNASLVEISRYRRVTLLPPVRLFALSILRDEIRTLYSPKIVTWMEEYAKVLYNHHSVKDAKEYRFLFAEDEPNLRFAVDLPCAPASDKALSTLGSLGPYLLQLYIFHNRWKEAEDVGDRILSNLRKLPDHLGEANTLTTLGMLAFRTGKLEEALKRYEKALAIYQCMDEKLWEANTFWALGNLNMRTGALRIAQTQYEKALAIYRNIDRTLGEANTLMRLGDLFVKTSNFKEAQTQYEKALAIYRNIDRKLGEANTLMRLGDLFVKTSNFKEAQTQYEKALAIYQTIDVKDGEARILIHLAQWAVLTNRLDHAETTLNNAFALYKDIEDLEGQAEAHLVKAFILLSRHNIPKAKKELRFCLSIQDRICAYSETAHWLTLYAAHLKSHRFQEGAKICLKYAEEFVSKALRLRLQSH
ncbi:MAG: tetratricopeptide repeat protein, partial [Theionarchaea archaeon]|nr:tetratricopeptide repeat protein [Theionarchaea archaeon]